VRGARLGQARAAAAGSGVDGDPRRASAELGALGVDLIVARTVDAIRESVARRAAPR
jgi:creatinine amidohydrolase/Fe(II)-dependent formamide hydrolase-like protein